MPLQREAQHDHRIVIRQLNRRQHHGVTPQHQRHHAVALGHRTGQEGNGRRRCVEVAEINLRNIAHCTHGVPRHLQHRGAGRVHSGSDQQPRPLHLLPAGRIRAQQQLAVGRARRRVRIQQRFQLVRMLDDALSCVFSKHDECLCGLPHFYVGHRLTNLMVIKKRPIGLRSAAGIGRGRAPGLVGWVLNPPQIDTNPVGSSRRFVPSPLAGEG